MYFILFCVLVSLSLRYGLTEEDDREDSQCGLLKHLLESSAVTVKIRKNGFHRELLTTVQLKSDDLTGIKVMLVNRWPRGVYLDPYQLASLRDQSELQILLDSTIDLELPAHKTTGFVSYVFLSTDGTTPGPLTVSLPIHARYNKPSSVGEKIMSVNIKPPQLLLRSEKCSTLHSSESVIAVEAPCNSKNSSTCSWVKLQQEQEHRPVSLEVPVGDGSLVEQVCAGSLLVTMICALGLSKYMWKHRIKQ